MKNKVFWISALVVWFVIGGIAWLAFVLWAFTRDSHQPATYNIRFGIVSANDEQPAFLKETNTLPLRYKDSGFRFGFEIKPSNDQPYTYHTVMHFSTPPKVLSGEVMSGQAPSNEVETSEEHIPGRTIVQNYWFDPGDPLGEQSIDVYINGKLVRTIKYTVVADK